MQDEIMNQKHPSFPREIQTLECIEQAKSEEREWRKQILSQCASRALD